VAVLRRLLADDDPWVREAAGFALAWHRDDRAPSAAALIRRLAVEEFPAARFSMLLPLSFVDPDGAARAVLTDALGADRPAADRLAAAIGLARSDPARCPADAVAVLLGSSGARIAAELGGSSWHAGELADLAAQARHLLSDAGLDLGPTVAEPVPEAAAEPVPEPATEAAAGEAAREEAAAEPLPTVPAGFAATVVDCWRPDGSLAAVACSPERLYFGGDFTSLAPRLPVPVLLDADGTVVAGMQEFNPVPTAVAADADGGFFVAGHPLGHGGYGDIVRLTPEGRLDPDFRAPVRSAAHPSLPHKPDTITVPTVGDGVLYAFGRFARIGDDLTTPLLGVVGLDRRTGRPTGFRAQAPARDMVAVPGRLIAGGGVAGSGVLGGAQTPTLSAFDARTGALLDWTVAASWTEGTVAKLAADRSTLYVQVFHKWPTGPSCHAFDLETGEERWQTTGLAHRWARLLAVHNGHLYLGPGESAKGRPADPGSRRGHRLPGRSRRRGRAVSRPVRCAVPDPTRAW